MNQRLQEQGIHLERLIYLTKEEFKFFKRLRDNFLKRAAKYFKEPRRAIKTGADRPLQRRLTRKQGLGLVKIGHEFKRIWKNREDMYFRWIRVGEYYKELKQEQTYEWQGKTAERIMKRAAYNKIIKY
jgi:hypothetical protein